MKAILKITTVVAFMLSTVVGMAREAKHSLIASKETKSFVFRMETQSDETIVKLIDANNVIVYFEKVEREGVYKKKFDLEKVENGFYSLRVENSQKIIMYKINVENNEVEVLEEKEEMKPVFRIKEDMVYVNLLNLGKESVELKVFDSSNRLIYKQKLEDELLVEKAFNFENAISDNYLVVVKDNNNTYFKEVVVD